MTVAEATTELALVNAAIARVSAGGISSYELGGRKVTYQDLEPMRAHRADLERVIANATSGGGIAFATFGRS